MRDRHRHLRPRGRSVPCAAREIDLGPYLAPYAPGTVYNPIALSELLESLGLSDEFRIFVREKLLCHAKRPPGTLEAVTLRLRPCDPRTRVGWSQLGNVWIKVVRDDDEGFVVEAWRAPGGDWIGRHPDSFWWRHLRRAFDIPEPWNRRI